MSRIVSGFGLERVDDLVPDGRRRLTEGARRGVGHRDKGTRRHMRSYDDEGLDCGAGGPWQARRRWKTTAQGAMGLWVRGVGAR